MFIKKERNSAVLDPDSPAIERTGWPVVVHHAVLAALLLADPQLPHGVQLLGRHLHWLPATQFRVFSFKQKFNFT